MAESIELQIKSDAQQATRAIGNLQAKLQGLGSTLNSLNGASISNFASGMSQLATSLRSVSSIDTRTFSKIATNMEKLGNLDTARLVSSASALKSMATELSGFANISKQSAEITQLTASISKLGSKSAGYAADNIRNLGSALKEVMTTLSNAPRVSNNIIQMTNALANLSQQGSKVGSASRSLVTGFSNTTKSIKSTRSGFRGLASTIGKFYATYWMVMRAVGKLGSAVDLASQLTEVQNVVDTTFGDMASKVDDFTKTSIQDFGMSELTVKQISSRFQALGTSVGITSQQVANGTALTNKALMSQNNTLYKTTDSMADMSLNLTKLAGDMASFYDVDQADVAKSLQSIFTGTIAPLRRYGLDLTQATLSEWAMKNGLDANIKSMTQAEKVLLRYNYVMANTQAAQGDFVKTANTWANSVRVLKQEFQAWGSIIGSVIINALKPFVQALNKVMLKVISFTRTVADALGAIFGWTIEISGRGSTVDGMEGIAGGVGDIGDSADESNKKAQKLKKTLLSIDEIHALDDNSDSGSGGGSGSGGSGGSGAGSGVDSSLKKTDGLLEKYKSSIKDLYSLGKYIGDALASAMESIDWKKIYQKADNFGKGLADFLNGLISPRLFYDLGATIAGSLNTALHFLNSFGTTFDWTNFGLSIANGINGFFENFDFALLAKTINAWAKGILNMLTTAVKNVDWANVGTQIGTFFANIDWVSVIGDLWQLASAIGGALINALDAWFQEDPLSATIVGGLALAKLTGLGKTLSKIWKDSWTTGDSSTFGEAISSTLKKVKVTVGLVITIEGVTYNSNSGSGDWKSDIIAPIITGIGVALAVNPLTGLAAGIGMFAANIGLRIGNALAGTKYSWKDVIGNLADLSFWKDLGHYLYVDEIEPAIEEWKDEIWPKINNTFAKLLNPLIKVFNKVFGKDIPTIKEKAVRDYMGAGHSIGETNDDIKKSTKSMSDNVKKSLEDTGKKTQKASSDFDSMRKNVSNSLTNVNTSIDGTKGKMDSMERKASTTSSNSRTSFSNLNAGVSGYLSGVNTSIDGTKGRMDSMSGKASGTSLSTSGSFSALSSNLYNSLSGVNGSLGNTKFNMGLFQDAAENMRRGTSNSFSTMASNASTYLGWTGGSFNGLKGKVDNTNGSLNTFKWYTNQSYSVGISSWGFSGVKSSIDGIVRSLDDLFKYNNKRFNITTGTKYMGYQSLLDRAPHFASGGFPEEGPFYMNRGEIVGKFSNGKTAVANNQQITEGIKQAVMEGMAQVMMNSNVGGNSAPIIENVFKCDSETLYRMTQVGKAKHGQRYIVANEFG